MKKLSTQILKIFAKKKKVVGAEQKTTNAFFVVQGGKGEGRIPPDPRLTKKTDDPVRRKKKSKGEGIFHNKGKKPQEEENEGW